MPIYGTEKAPYVRVTELSPITLSKLMEIVKESEKEFKFDQVFLHSLEYNKDFKEVYILKYDVSRTNIDTHTYQSYIERLVSIANQRNLDKVKYKAKKKKILTQYMFDIMGNFTTGKIIVMTKNKEY